MLLSGEMDVGVDVEQNLDSCMHQQYLSLRYVLQSTHVVVREEAILAVGCGGQGKALRCRPLSAAAAGGGERPQRRLRLLQSSWRQQC
jgi:hypothetical protein